MLCAPLITANDYTCQVRETELDEAAAAMQVDMEISAIFA